MDIEERLKSMILTNDGQIKDSEERLPYQRHRRAIAQSRIKMCDCLTEDIEERLPVQVF